MIDNNLYLSLQLCALTALVGIGIWRVYRTRISPESDVSAPAAYDMRRDGQRLSLQTATR